jgi:hypothetical protein
MENRVPGQGPGDAIDSAGHRRQPPKLAEDIHTQLQLAIPGLLANLAEKARSSD